MEDFCFLWVTSAGQAEINSKSITNQGSISLLEHPKLPFFKWAMRDFLPLKEIMLLY